MEIPDPIPPASTADNQLAPADFTSSPQPAPSSLVSPSPSLPNANPDDPQLGGAPVAANTTITTAATTPSSSMLETALLPPPVSSAFITAVGPFSNATGIGTTSLAKTTSSDSTPAGLLAPTATQSGEFHFGSLTGASAQSAVSGMFVGICAVLVIVIALVASLVARARKRRRMADSTAGCQRIADNDCELDDLGAGRRGGGGGGGAGEGGGGRETSHDDMFLGQKINIATFKTGSSDFTTSAGGGVAKVVDAGGNGTATDTPSASCTTRQVAGPDSGDNNDSNNKNNNKKDQISKNPFHPASIAAAAASLHPGGTPLSWQQQQQQQQQQTPTEALPRIFVRACDGRDGMLPWSDRFSDRRGAAGGGNGDGGFSCLSTNNMANSATTTNNLDGASEKTGPTAPYAAPPSAASTRSADFQTRSIFPASDNNGGFTAATDGGGGSGEYEGGGRQYVGNVMTGWKSYQNPRRCRDGAGGGGGGASIGYANSSDSDAQPFSQLPAAGSGADRGVIPGGRREVGQAAFEDVYGLEAGDSRWGAAAAAGWQGSKRRQTQRPHNQDRYTYQSQPEQVGGGAGSGFAMGGEGRRGLLGVEGYYYPGPPAYPNPARYPGSMACPEQQSGLVGTGHYHHAEQGQRQGHVLSMASSPPPYYDGGVGRAM